MYFKSLTLTALLVLQCTATGASAFSFRNMIEIVHGSGAPPADTVAPQHSANYHSVFARDADPVLPFELEPISVKDKIISLKRRAVSGCEQEYTVQQGETCHDVVDKFGIHLYDFYYWNPQINSRCKNMKAGKRYCVKNSDAGAEPEACAVRHKVVEGDTCTSVAKEYGISKGEFFKLNPELSVRCSNLKIGYSYCISPAKSIKSQKGGNAAAKKKAAAAAAKKAEEEEKAAAAAAKKKAEEKEEAAAAAAAKKKAEEKEKEAAAAKKKAEEEEEAAAAAKKKAEEEEQKEKANKKISESVTNLVSKAKSNENDDSAKKEKEDDKDSSSSSAEKRKVIQSNIPMTYYWIAMPQDYNQGGKKVAIKTCSGKVLGYTSVDYADALVMEGTGILGNKVVNLGACGCTNYNCFMELDKNEDPYGLTSYSTPLRPFITVAANDLPRGTKIYVPQLDGWKLPGGKTHNGCLLVDDQGWSFSSRHIDFYVYSMDNYETLNKEHRISKVDVYEGGSCNLISYM